MYKCANYQVRKKEAGLNATENLEKMSQFLFKMSRECVGDRQERRMRSWLTHNWATERESRKAQSQDTQEKKKKKSFPDGASGKESESEVLSHVRLFVSLWNIAHQAPPSM